MTPIESCQQVFGSACNYLIYGYVAWGWLKGFVVAWWPAFAGAVGGFIIGRACAPVGRTEEQV